MGNQWNDLPLFNGPHLPRIRFQRAMDRLDLAAAVADAPGEWRDAVTEMASALGDGTPASADLNRLRRCRCLNWLPPLERTWQRLVGRCLDDHRTPAVLDGELAAAYLLRGGERERARRSVGRHLEQHPCDHRGWELLSQFEPVRGAARCAFHGGPVLDVAAHLIDAIVEDELEPVGPWLLSYGWFSGELELSEIAHALTAEGVLSPPVLPVGGDPRGFAWYLLDAGARPLGLRSVGVVEARERLQRISPVAFRRYLRRVSAQKF